MTFHPPKIIRFYFRYLMIAIFILFPLYLITEAIFDPGFIAIEDRPAFFVVMSVLVVFGCLLIYFAFWKKFFGILILDDNKICWKCVFRRPRVMSLSDCVEIGAYTEHENKGIPVPQIYFSDHRWPQRHMDKNGSMKASGHLIKYWYNEELCDYLIKNYPGNKTGSLLAYRIRQKRK